MQRRRKLQSFTDAEIADGIYCSFDKIVEHEANDHNPKHVEATKQIALTRMQKNEKYCLKKEFPKRIDYLYVKRRLQQTWATTHQLEREECKTKEH